jgi:hypothetical protein
VRSGESRLCRIKVTGAISEPVAEFVSRDNKVLGRVKLRPFSPEPDGELIGTAIVPPVPFRTMVSGRDSDGHLFQRVTSAIYTPADKGGRHSGDSIVNPAKLKLFVSRGGHE